MLRSHEATLYGLIDVGNNLTLYTVNINNATRTEVCSTATTAPLDSLPTAFDGYGDTLYIYYAGTYDTIYTLDTSDCYGNMLYRLAYLMLGPSKKVDAIRLHQKDTGKSTLINAMTACSCHCRTGSNGSPASPTWPKWLHIISVTLRPAAC